MGTKLISLSDYRKEKETKELTEEEKLRQEWEYDWVIEEDAEKVEQMYKDYYSEEV